MGNRSERSTRSSKNARYVGGWGTPLMSSAEAGIKPVERLLTSWAKRGVGPTKTNNSWQNSETVEIGGRERSFEKIALENNCVLGYKMAMLAPRLPTCLNSRLVCRVFFRKQQSLQKSRRSVGYPALVLQSNQRQAQMTLALCMRRGFGNIPMPAKEA